MTQLTLDFSGPKRGCVKWYNAAKGYGFIQADNDADNRDIFAHHTSVIGPDLVEGQEVTFDLVDSPKGPIATNVRGVE